MPLNPNFDQNPVGNRECFQICYQTSQDHPIITETYFGAAKLVQTMPNDGRQLLCSENTMVVIHRGNVYYPRNGKLFLITENIGHIVGHQIGNDGTIALEKKSGAVTIYRGSFLKISHIKTSDIM